MSNVAFTDTPTADDTRRSTGQVSGTGSRDSDSGTRGAGTDLRESILSRVRTKSADIRHRRIQSYVQTADDQPGTDSPENRVASRGIRDGLAGSSADPTEDGSGHLLNGGLHGRAGRTDRPVGNGDSSVNPATRGPGESGSGRDTARTAVTEENVIVVGGDDVPPQPRKRGRPKKTIVVDSQPIPEPEPEYESGERPRIINPLTLFRSGSALSVAEANTLRPFLLEAVKAYSDYADDAMTHSNRNHAEAVIWSTMDDQEIACIVDTLLSGGRKSAAIAYVAREMVRVWRMVQVGVILVPRWFKTMRFYAENGGFGLW